MAWDINQVVLIGRLTRDPQLSQTSGNNTPVCRFSIANNRGKNQDDVSFFDITAWNQTAERCAQYLTKGSQVAVEGRLRQFRFQDKSGQNRSKVEVVANTVQFLGTRDGGNQNFNRENRQYDNSRDPYSSGGNQEYGYNQNPPPPQYSGAQDNYSQGGYGQEKEIVFDKIGNDAEGDEVPF
jgi:single-strand DNA-binding protein